MDNDNIQVVDINRHSKKIKKFTVEYFAYRFFLFGTLAGMIFGLYMS